MARSFCRLYHHTPVSQSINQSVISQSIIKSVSQSKNPVSVITQQSINQSVSQSSNQSVNQQISQPSHTHTQHYAVSVPFIISQLHGRVLLQDLSSHTSQSINKSVTHQSVNLPISQSSAQCRFVQHYQSLSLSSSPSCMLWPFSNIFHHTRTPASQSINQLVIQLVIS